MSEASDAARLLRSNGFHEVKGRQGRRVFTDGVNEVHVPLRNAGNALFIKSLRSKLRRWAETLSQKEAKP